MTDFRSISQPDMGMSLASFLSLFQEKFPAKPRREKKKMTPEIDDITAI